MCNNDLVRTAKAFIEVRKENGFIVIRLDDCTCLLSKESFPSTLFVLEFFYCSSSFERFFALKKGSAKANTQQKIVLLRYRNCSLHTEQRTSLKNNLRRLFYQQSLYHKIFSHGIEKRFFNATSGFKKCQKEANETNRF